MVVLLLFTGGGTALLCRMLRSSFLQEILHIPLPSSSSSVDFSSFSSPSSSSFPFSSSFFSSIAPPSTSLFNLAQQPLSFSSLFALLSSSAGWLLTLRFRLRHSLFVLLRYVFRSSVVLLRVVLRILVRLIYIAMDLASEHDLDVSHNLSSYPTTFWRRWQEEQHPANANFNFAFSSSSATATPLTAPTTNGDVNLVSIPPSSSSASSFVTTSTPIPTLQDGEQAYVDNETRYNWNDVGLSIYAQILFYCLPRMRAHVIHIWPSPNPVPHMTPMVVTGNALAAAAANVRPGLVVEGGRAAAAAAAGEETVGEEAARSRHWRLYVPALLPSFSASLPSVSL